MGSVRTLVWSTVVLLAAVGPAHALKPGTHATIAKASCAAAGLPAPLCTRIATEDYNTDNREWDDLRAHAQIDAGETACTAADRTAERLRELGGELRTLLPQVARTGSADDVGKTASAIGRALHTIQDNCAHHGMPNPQHAWASLSDFCDGTTLSPDIQDDALACARRETDAVMVVVAAAVKREGVGGLLGGYACPPAPTSGDHDTSSSQTVCDARVLPGPLDGCSFLGEAAGWDGTDRRWNNDVVVPALRQAFLAGLAGSAAPGAICGGDERVLSPAVSDPVEDVTAGPPTCARAHLLCLGKADGETDNPFADDPADDAATGGCAAGAPGSARTAGALVLAALLLRRRRQRRSHA